MILRRAAGLVLLCGLMALWLPSSDVVALIVKQQPVMLGRYSQTHLGYLMLITIVGGTAIGLVLSGKPPKVRMLGNGLLIVGSILVGLLLVTFVSRYVFEPRYAETRVTLLAQDAPGGIELTGVVRHRQPNRRFEYTYVDRPIHPRSYPNPPPGHPDVAVTLTVDANGFRNSKAQEDYDVLVVGDSFVAGSHVDDEQTWTSLLARTTGVRVYNMGVSGADPQHYLNNLIHAQRGGVRAPRLIVSIYEGNDFREVRRYSSRAAGLRRFSAGLGGFREWFGDSPLRNAYEVFSQRVLQAVASDAPVSDYARVMGWMPVAVSSGRGTNYYAFRPSRAGAMNVVRSSFVESSGWKSMQATLDDIARVARARSVELTVLFAASKPLVVMPLIESRLTADQLRRFLAYEYDELAPAGELFEQFFANVGTREAVLSEYCETKGIRFISTTRSLREATRRGEQTYFTYDQHWSPAGHAVVADLVGDRLSAVD